MTLDKTVAEPQSSGYRLIRLHEGSKGEIFPLTAENLTIGRGEENQVALEDTRASREHAFVSTRDGATVIEDRNSHNGTFVNERRIWRHVLRPGDVIRIGRSIFLYEADERLPEMFGWIRARLEDTEITLPLTGQPILIGSSPEADIQLQTSGKKDFVGLIVAQKDGIELIRLDVEPLRRSRLSEGATVRFGGMTITYQMDAPQPEVLQLAESLPPRKPDETRAVPPPGKKGLPPLKSEKDGEPSMIFNRHIGDRTLLDYLQKETERQDIIDHVEFPPKIDPVNTLSALIHPDIEKMPRRKPKQDKK